MQFSDSSQNQGLVQDVLNLCRATTGAYPINDITRNINNAYHDVTRLIWECAGGWQYDDSNKSDLPIATADLVADQQDYTLPSIARRISLVTVKNDSGDWEKLKQLDIHDIKLAPAEYYEDSGMPERYDLVGRSLFLYPAPSSTDVTTTAGLKVYFHRDITEFSPSDTTDEPGFPPQFHRILSLSATLDFEEDAGRRNFFLAERQRLIEGLKKFYSGRDIERRGSIRPKRNWRLYV